MRSLSVANTPIKVKQSLEKMGAFIRIARKRRRLPLSECVARAQTSILTLRKIECGDPSVSMGTVMGVLWVLGLMESVDSRFDPSLDKAGLVLEEQRLPTRIRSGLQGEKDI